MKNVAVVHKQLFFLFKFCRLKTTPNDQSIVLWSSCCRTETCVSGYGGAGYKVLELTHLIINLLFCFYHLKVPLLFIIQLAASRSLYFHIEDAAFSQQQFSDLLPVCWKLSFKLVEDVQEFDSKVQVLNTISVLIAYVGDIIPYANELVQFFQKVSINLITALFVFHVSNYYVITNWKVRPTAIQTDDCKEI